ncbi:winged helix-turn-helix domain-containing protein [Pseudoalteromonas 'SMAR']|uniref:winged helix-turn-helix domain-containing protein n=1 Tax=Pseudoalteromonas 'SMAR' TaxID=3416908 RepID=UPI003AF2B762
MAVQQSHYFFGQWQFDSDQDTLTSTCGKVIKLEPQSARLLLLLLSHSQQVLNKYWLCEQIWPDTIVDPNSLYQLITKLRKVLEDNPRSALYIKTIPKKGYQFIAPLKSQAAPLETGSSSAPPSSKKNGLMILATTMMALLCFGAIAYFNTAPAEKPMLQYQTSNLSHELGLEFDVDAHQRQNLLAYVKDFTQLVIANKQGDKLRSHQFDTRVAAPSWSPSADKLAFWQYQGNGCQLHVMTAAGQFYHSSRLFRCELGVKPVWQNDEELILVYGPNKARTAYIYRLNSQQLVKLPLQLARGEQLKMAIRGWGNKVYYLVQTQSRQSRLQQLDGSIALQWQKPVTSVAFDTHHQSILASQHGQLQRYYLDGSSQSVKTTELGLFTSFSSDENGDIFAALESFQVNIKDRDNLPLFSSSSIDYLPLTNKLGETAFMSRRSGVCEVYLYRNDQISQLSFHQGNEYVHFLQWSPALNYLASNRDSKLVVYDRKRPLQQFDSQLEHAVVSMGWIDEQTLWAFDGNTLNQYSLSGALVSSQSVNAQSVFYHPQRQTWFLLQDNQLLESTTVLSAAESTLNRHTLTPQQANQFSNLRIRGNQVYWQSTWSQQDYIWRLALSGNQAPTLQKTGHLIWHYDIDPLGNLLIAKMESVEGDIKKLTLLPNTAITD